MDFNDIITRSNYYIRPGSWKIELAIAIILVGYLTINDIRAWLARRSKRKEENGDGNVP